MHVGYKAKDKLVQELKHLGFTNPKARLGVLNANGRSKGKLGVDASLLLSLW